MRCQGSGAKASLFGVDPATYERHPLHAPSRAYSETNCYSDILVELLHARGDEPLAALGSTVHTDFEGDQFTFFKPAHDELQLLFGIDIHEMQPYRSLAQQAAEQLAVGRTLIVEVDSYYLPDTAATSYHHEHVKSSIIIESIDPASAQLRYFHNAGLYDLEGDDFRGAFRCGHRMDVEVLPPYTELVRFDAGARQAGERLRSAARELLSGHLIRVPATNPFERFGSHLVEHLPRLVEGEEAGYHAYAFATTRMAGAAFEVAASYVEWVLGEGGLPAAKAFGQIVAGSKTLSFKLARRRLFDPLPEISALAAAWDEGQGHLRAAAC